MNKSGYLDRQELDKVVDFMYTTLGCGAVRDKEVAKYDLLHRADNNRDGKLNVNEFISLFEQIYLEVSLQSAFDIYPYIYSFLLLRMKYTLPRRYLSLHCR